MKLVIWGLGYLGKSLVDYLGKQYVGAIIESDHSKIGQEYKEIKIISFDNYMESYNILPIIITPDYQYRREISQQLKEHQIYHFSFGDELPPNIHYNGIMGLDCYLDMIDKSKKIYLYGINSFSVILYLLLFEYAEQIFFIIEKDKVRENQAAIIALLQFQVIDINSFVNGNEPLYITTHENAADIDRICLDRHVVDAYRYADSREEYRNLELEKFHNCCINKRRCFIVATGPSLTIDDLDMLLVKQEFCFSVNSICKVETRWKPDVYVVSDGKFFAQNQELIRHYHCPIKFLPNDNIDFWKQKREGEYQIHRDYADAYDVVEFSEDIAQIVNPHGTVTVACIQIAVYMGFKEIYLLGTDCNYVIGSSNNHFGGDDKPDMIDHSISAMLKGYQMCRDHADTHGIKIYNATRGGMLEVFERVDFDSLFEDKK